MTTDTLDLDQRFAEADDREADAGEVRVRRLLGQSVGMTWDEMLEHPRVVLLAEAGADKTSEMRAAAGRLQAVGETAVFLSLETLREVVPWGVV